jgi:hypothetical protein
MRWSEFAAQQHVLAGVVHDQLIKPGAACPRRIALFAVDITDVTYIGHDPGTSAQHVARWPAGEEYLRPSLTPTTLGPPKPVRRLLARTT